MEAPKRKLDQFHVQFATDHHKSAAESRIRSSLEYLTDARKKARLNDAIECKWCFYFCISRIGGAAMTNWNCGICEKEEMAGSTAVPWVCKPCAKKHSICAECGGDLHLRVLRKFEVKP